MEENWKDDRSGREREIGGQERTIRELKTSLENKERLIQVRNMDIKIVNHTRIRHYSNNIVWSGLQRADGRSKRARCQQRQPHPQAQTTHSGKRQSVRGE